MNQTVNREREEALALANRILDRPNADPDDDIAILARQLLRCTEALEAYRNAYLNRISHGGTDAE